MNCTARQRAHLLHGITGKHEKVCVIPEQMEIKRIYATFCIHTPHGFRDEKELNPWEMKYSKLAA